MRTHDEISPVTDATLSVIHDSLEIIQEYVTKEQTPYANSLLLHC